MGFSFSARDALSLCAVAALLGGCGVLRAPFDSAQGNKARDDMQLPIGAPSAMAQNAPRVAYALPDWKENSDSRYRIVYNFEGTPDGANPYTSLTPVDGTFYGTTSSGGEKGQGTVFELSASGQERALYSFKGTPDGSRPEAGLIYVGGKLYGTTVGGGTKGDGTVFEVAVSGKERVLHSFKNVPDGYYPLTPLIAANGALYGTTVLGGSSTCKPYSSGVVGCGTVFKVAMSGEEQVLYRFGDVRADGVEPWAPLLAIGDEFYSTTEGGGEYGDGTVYAVSGSGKERAIYSFKGPPDGAYPLAGLIAVNGELFGTTFDGGSYGNSGGDGALFKMSKTGTDERVLYSFGGKVGQSPNAVLALKGKLYGTTGGGFLGGTVFEMSRAGKDARLLHGFTGPPDGADPNGLTYFEGALYGTTILGGTYGSNGDGTIFELTIPSR